MSLFDWLKRRRHPQSGQPATAPVLPATAPTEGPSSPIALDADQMWLLMAALDPNASLEPKRPLLYLFQHVALREAAFENHPELIRELAEPPSHLPLLHFWSRASLQCERAGPFADDPSGEDDAALTAEREWLDAVRIHPYARDGYTAHIVTLPAPEASPEAYFVAIVHKDDEPHEYRRESPSTRYFTLEQADLPAARPLLCEWLRDGSRENYGEGPVPTREAFAAAVFERVLAGAGRRV